MAERDPIVEELRRRVVALSLEGWSVRQIGREVDKCPSYIHEILTQELSAIPAAKAAALRQLENEKLDATERRLIAAFSLASAVITTLIDEEHPELGTKQALADPEAMVEVAGALAALRGRRAKLNGLDTPVKTDVALTFEPGDATPAKARAIMAELFGNVKPPESDESEVEGDGQAGEPDAEDAPESAPAA